MSTHLSPEHAQVLQQLDPASPADPGRGMRSPAQAVLSHLVGLPHKAHPGLAPARSRAWRRGMLVAAVAALVLAVSSSVVNGSSPAAASWTAQPRALTPDVTAARGAYCLRLLALPAPYSRSARATIVEQRGAYTFTLVTSPQGLIATCLDRDNGPSQESSGGGSKWVGPRAALAPDGMLTDGLYVGSDDDISTRAVVGRVGSSVRGVVVHTAQHGPVTATIADGYFAAWWPGAPLHGTDGVGPDPTFSLNLRDGTTREVSMTEADVTP